MGRIEHTLVDGGRSSNPIRPKTITRTLTIPQKSYECFNLRLTKGARAGVLPIGAPAFC